MSKKHFEYMAHQIRNIQDKRIKEILIEFCVRMGAKFNPNFDKNRFIFACGPLEQPKV